MSVELALSPQLERSQVVAFYHHPVQEMHGLEVLENIQERGYNAGYNRVRGVEQSYRNFRESVILQAPLEKASFIGVLGITGSGKSSFHQGLYRVLLADQYIKHVLNEEGLSLDVVPVPFSLYAEAAKTPTVRREQPDFAVDPEKKHGGYTRDEYQRISALMEHDISTYIVGHSNENKTTVVLIEPSSPTAYPEPGNPTNIIGINRGLTSLFTRALEKETSSRLDIYALERDTDVGEDASTFREKVLRGSSEPADVFIDPITVVYTDYHEMSEGKDLEVSTLPKRVQEKVRKFMTLIAATPAAKARSDKEFEEIKSTLRESGVIFSESDRRYFRFIQQQLQLPDARFHYVSNPHLLGRKTLDLDYFIHSLPVRLYPEIVPQR